MILIFSTPSYETDRLKEELLKKTQNFKIINNQEIIWEFDNVPESPSVVYFYRTAYIWPELPILVERFKDAVILDEIRKKNVIVTKTYIYQKLKEAGLPIVKSIKIKDPSKIDKIEKKIGFPLVA